MWVELTDAEVATVIAAVREGSVVDKLCAHPDPRTGAFVGAAERNDLPNIHVEDFGLIRRYESGAYVMCWRWVSEKEAGLATSHEPIGLSEGIASPLKTPDPLHVGFDARHHTTKARQGSPEQENATDGDIIYTADLKLCATMYVRAKNLREAQKVVDSFSGTCLDVTQGMIGESSFTDRFPEVEIAENMTIYGQFDGDILQPRYDLANDIDYG